jgi:Tfp pilus assembly protein PilF
MITALIGMTLSFVLAGQGVVDPAEEAVGLARAGRYEAALERFRQLAAKRPHDIDARVWIARLLEWTGHAADAERDLRQILVDAPQAVDAKLALGSLLANRGRLAEALAVLEEGERAAPDRGDVLAALGRVHRFAGRTALSLAYYRRAEVLDPDDRDIRDGLEVIRRQHAHRVQSTVAYEGYSRAILAARSIALAVDLRASDRLRVELEGQFQQKFEQDEGRVGGGVSWRARPATTVHAAAFLGPGATVLPKADALIDVERAGAHVDLLGSARVARFETADVAIFAPGLRLPLHEAISVTAQYYVSATAFTARTDTVVNHSGRLSLRARVHPRVWAEVGFARGNESVETLSVERLGSFQANTISGGVRVEHRSLTSIGAVGEYQSGDNGRVARLTVNVARRF